MSAQIVLNFTTNLNRAVEIVPLNGAYFVGDAKSHKFIIEAKRGSAHESLAGMTITAYFERAGGATVLLAGEVDGEGRAVVTLNDSCYAKKGRFQIAIRATKGEEKATIFCGYGGMYVTESDTVVTDEKVVASIEDLLKRVEEIEQATQEAKAAAARAEEAAERAESAGGTGGGSGTDERLPQVSEADNGKALVVVDGEWAASEVVGEPGEPGEPGKDGVGIASVEQTTTSTEDGGSNVITVTKTDGSKSTITVLNGTKGSDGNAGQRGAAILRITTSPSGYTTAVDGFTPSYRVSLSTVKSQARVGSVYIGDTILQSYYTYPVGRVDSSYVYLGGRTSIRGAQGEAGNNGNGILSVEQTTVSTEDGGVNIFTVTETDGTTSEFAVRNGSKGTPGADGMNGYTPVKYTDYFTPADQESIVQQVIAALGTPVFGTVDENNNIILSGELADGTYTVKYEDADGNMIEVGTIEKGGPSTFNVPITWIIGTKLSKTTGAVESTTATEYNASDFISLVNGASYVIATQNDCYNSMNVVYYNDGNTFVGYQADLWTSNQVAQNQGVPRSASLIIPSGATKIRLRQFESANDRGWTHSLITLTGTIEGGSVPDAPSASYTNVLASAVGYDGAVFNGVGYKDGQRLTGTQTSADNNCYLSANASFFATGFMPYTLADAQNCVPFYVKGVNLETSNLGDYSRIGLFSSRTASEYVEMCKLSNTAANGVTITKLADLYYKITPNSNFYYTGDWRTNNPTCVRISMPGSGSGVIITINEPIE